MTVSNGHCNNCLQGMEYIVVMYTKICLLVDFNKLKDFEDFDRAAVFDVIFALRQHSYF